MLESLFDQAMAAVLSDMTWIWVVCECVGSATDGPHRQMDNTMAKSSRTLIVNCARFRHSACVETVVVVSLVAVSEASEYLEPATWDLLRASIRARSWSSKKSCMYHLELASTTAIPWSLASMYQEMEGTDTSANRDVGMSDRCA